MSVAVVVAVLLFAALFASLVVLLRQKAYLSAYRMLIDHSRDLMWVKDDKLRLFIINKAYSEVYGKKKEELLGKTDLELSPRVLAEGYKRDDEFVVKTDAEYVYEENEKGDCWFHTVKFPWHSLNGLFNGCGGVARNITDSKLRQLKFEQISNIDPLTGLPNRSCIVGRMQNMITGITGDSCLAVALVGVDSFRSINDCAGNRTCDEFIRLVSFRLGRACHSLGADVGRVGGDVFCIFLPMERNQWNNGDMQARISSVFAEPFTADDMSVHLTASTGLSVYPDDAGTVQALLATAELAMRRAKRMGFGKSLRYSNDMSIAQERSRKIASRLCSALKNGEISVVYQPRLSASGDGRVLGCEALIRWKNPELGELYPRDFLDEARMLHLISSFDVFVLKNSVERSIELAASLGRFIELSVNVSAELFLRDDFARRLRDFLNEKKYPESKLIIEISEKEFMSQPEKFSRAVRAARELGIRVCLDNFGSSVSFLGTSTGYLFDKVTVDRSIISRLRNREDAPQLLRILMSYAQSCSKRITVEGVENIDDLRKFSGLPLECLQGFYFSPPLSAELFEDFVFSHAKSEPHDSPAPAAAAIPSFNSAPAADSSEVLF